MSAIQTCRTAALGGHVDGCDDCGYLRVAYNSCRNRHCPKCQAAAARTWLAERKADLLPVGYFHVVFTLPAEIADIAWQQLRREGEDIARCAVERLMRSMGLQGVIRGKPVKTTISDKAAPCPLDHVNRQF
jgi:hypothetical protein